MTDWLNSYQHNYISFIVTNGSSKAALVAIVLLEVIVHYCFDSASSDWNWSAYYQLILAELNYY